MRRPAWRVACGLAVAMALLGMPGAQAAGQVTVLLHHPNDGVDPFGFPYSAAGDYFTTRYGPLVADKQRFDFPFFVADGVLPIEKLPNPAVPFDATRAAYEAATALRLAEEAPVTLRLASSVAGPSAVLALHVEPTVPLPDEDANLMVALAEDPVRYLPPPGLTNGVEDHRFTVRAIADLGPVDLSAASEKAHTFTLDEAWALDRLVVAAWLQQDAPSPRFDAREVLQATHAGLGEMVEQGTKGVLLEMLSATWCDPCLYGDLAIEAVAVGHGVAQPLPAGEGLRYFVPPASPVLAALAAVGAGLAVAWLGGRK